MITFGTVLLALADLTLILYILAYSLSQLLELIGVSLKHRYWEDRPSLPLLTKILAKRLCLDAFSESARFLRMPGDGRTDKLIEIGIRCGTLLTSFRNIS